jgi:hypothetical protein
MKVVVNGCYGGFGLSDKAYERLIALGVPVRKYVKQERGKDGKFNRPTENEGEIIFDRDLSPDEDDILGGGGRRSEMFGRYWDCWTRENRTHPLVVKVVEELGPKASAKLAKLAVVEIPEGVDWEIDEYDGIETVRERSRSWG